MAWVEIKLPPLKFGYDGIAAFFVEDGGNTISVYRCIGPADGGKATRYSFWKTTDGGETWEELGEEILYPDQEKQLGFIPSEGSFGGGSPDPLKNESETVEQSVNPLNTYGQPLIESRYGNNIFVVVCYFPFEEQDYSHLVFRLFLSTNGGKDWGQVSFPPQFSSFDAYPETPQLTLLKEGGTPNRSPAINWIDIVSLEDGTIQLFMLPISGDIAGFSRATIKSPN